MHVGLTTFQATQWLQFTAALSDKNSAIADKPRDAFRG